MYYNVLRKFLDTATTKQRDVETLKAMETEGVDMLWEMLIANHEGKLLNLPGANGSLEAERALIKKLDHDFREWVITENLK